MRPQFPVAVHLFFLREDQVLLLRRFNTGFEDGKYSVVAGHVEAGETITRAAIREAREEVGVALDAREIEVVQVMQRKSDEERIDFFLAVRGWTGDIVNGEPHKCDDLSWCPIASLPSNTIPYVRQAIENYQQGVWFCEFGWDGLEPDGFV